MFLIPITLLVLGTGYILWFFKDLIPRPPLTPTSRAESDLEDLIPDWNPKPHNPPDYQVESSDTGDDSADD